VIVWYPLTAVACAFAAWRCFVLTARDMVLDGPRDRLAPVGTTRRDFLECPYCAGFWWSGVWSVGLWLAVWPPLDGWSVGLGLLTWWTVSAWVAILEHLVDRLTE